MANLNVHLDDSYWEKFKDLKRILKCNTNEEAQIKIIDLVQEHLQKQMINHIKGEGVQS